MEYDLHFVTWAWTLTTWCSDSRKIFKYFLSCHFQESTMSEIDMCDNWCAFDQSTTWRKCTAFKLFTLWVDKHCLLHVIKQEDITGQICNCYIKRYHQNTAYHKVHVYLVLQYFTSYNTLNPLTCSERHLSRYLLNILGKLWYYYCCEERAMLSKELQTRFSSFKFTTCFSSFFTTHSLLRSKITFTFTKHTFSTPFQTCATSVAT